MSALGTQLNVANLGAVDPFVPDGQPSIFTFSDGYKVAFYQGAGGKLYWRSISTAGALGTETAISGGGLGITAGTLYTFVQVANVIYIIGVSSTYFSGPNQATFGLVTFTWNASTHALTSAVGTTGGRPLLGAYSGTISSLDAVWNSTNSVFYILVVVSGSAILLQTTTAFSSFNHINAERSQNQIYRARIDAASQSASQLFLTFNVQNQNLYLATYLPAPNGTLPNITAYETAYSGSIGAYGCAFDSSGNLDIVGVNTITTALYAVKRLGPNNYTPAVTLDANMANANTGGGGQFGGSAPALAYNSANGDLWVFYVTGVNYPTSGEVAFVRRQSGTWGSRVILIGGDANSYTNPSVNNAIQSNGNADILYWYNELQVQYVNAGGSATPYTPVGITPYGTSNATPTFAFSAPNPVGLANDPQGAYEILVTAAVGGASMWDSGIVSSSAQSGIAYGGSALSADTDYLWQVRSRDSVGSSWSDYSAQVRFTVRTLPVASIMTVSPAIGSASNGSASGTLNGATAANAASLTVQAGQHSNYTVGHQVAVGTSPNIDVVTLGTPTGDVFPVTPNLVHGHSNGDPVVQTDNTIASLTAPGLTALVAVEQAQSHSLNGYQVLLFASDAVTLLYASPLTAINQAPATSFVTASQDLHTYMTNGGVYYLAIAVTDATTGALAISALWKVTANYTAPGAPTGLTPTIDSNAGTISLAWTNGSNTATNNVYRRPTGTTPWELLPAGSGTLRTTAKIWGHITVPYDYGVSGVSANGVESAITVITNQVIPPKWGTYGVWLNQLPSSLNYAGTITNMANLNAALGLVAAGDWQDASGLDYLEDELTTVNMGRSKPTTNFGISDYAQAVGRKYYIFDDTQSGVTVTAHTVVAALEAMRGVRGGGLLYRDYTGEYRYVCLTVFHKEVDQAVARIVTMTLRDFDWTLGPPVQ